MALVHLVFLGVQSNQADLFLQQDLAFQEFPLLLVVPRGQVAQEVPYLLSSPLDLMVLSDLVLLELQAFPIILKVNLLLKSFYKLIHTISPGIPGNPCWPGLPGGPTLPGGPLSPMGPGAPSCPGLPGLPCGPLGQDV